MTSHRDTSLNALTGFYTALPQKESYVTKKDYILIAKAINMAHMQSLGNQKEGAELSALFLARSLADENPLFNRNTFLKACGLNVKGI